MTFFAAALWSIAALFARDVIAGVMVSVRPASLFDPVTGVLCQALAFVGTLYLLAMMKEKGYSAGEVLGFRRVSIWLVVLSFAIGVALQFPLDLFSELIEKRFPLSDDARSAMEQFLDASTGQRRFGLFFAAGLVGPLVEEIFFRGAIFRGLRKKHPPTLTLIGTALLFAAAHRDLRSALPVFLGGLWMGYVRWLSGSVWPAIALHVAFNSTAVLLLLKWPSEDASTHVRLVALATAAVALLGALFRAAATKSPETALAREQDSGQ